MGSSFQTNSQPGNREQDITALQLICSHVWQALSHDFFKVSGGTISSTAHSYHLRTQDTCPPLKTMWPTDNRVDAKNLKKDTTVHSYMTNMEPSPHSHSHASFQAHSTVVGQNAGVFHRSQFNPVLRAKCGRDNSSTCDSVELAVNREQGESVALR